MSRLGVVIRREFSAAYEGSLRTRENLDKPDKALWKEAANCE